MHHHLCRKVHQALRPRRAALWGADNAGADGATSCGSGRGKRHGKQKDDPADEMEAQPPHMVAVPGEGEMGVIKILKHHVYGGASAGSLFNVYVRVMYEGGRRSNGFISAEALAGSQVLREYTRTDKGQKIAKYVQD